MTTETPSTVYGIPAELAGRILDEVTNDTWAWIPSTSSALKLEGLIMGRAHIVTGDTGAAVATLVEHGLLGEGYALTFTADGAEDYSCNLLELTHTGEELHRELFYAGRKAARP